MHLSLENLVSWHCYVSCLILSGNLFHSVGAVKVKVLSPFAYDCNLNIGGLLKRCSNFDLLDNTPRYKGSQALKGSWCQLVHAFTS